MCSPIFRLDTRRLRYAGYLCKGLISSTHCFHGMVQVEDETPLLDPRIPLSEFPSALTQIAIDCV
jgi:hypothetical protein